MVSSSNNNNNLISRRVKVLLVLPPVRMLLIQYRMVHLLTAKTKQLSTRTTAMAMRSSTTMGAILRAPRLTRMLNSTLQICDNALWHSKIKYNIKTKALPARTIAAHV